MNITFDIDDYLSEDDKREIARTEFKRHCTVKFMQDAERIFSNAAYTAVAEMVNQQMDGQLSEIIRDKAIGVINGLSTHTVFGPANAWEKEASKGWTFLQQSIDDSQHLVKDRVEEVIANLDKGYILARLEELMYNVVEDRLIGKKPECQ